jgi:hypothetical protein
VRNLLFIVLGIKQDSVLHAKSCGFKNAAAQNCKKTGSRSIPSSLSKFNGSYCRISAALNNALSRLAKTLAHLIWACVKITRIRFPVFFEERSPIFFVISERVR